MSETALKVDVAEWVERVRADPVAYQQRQTAEIALNTIAMMAPLGARMVLKGGILVGLAYDSPRQTTDIDLTADFAADSPVRGRLRELLSSAFPRAAARLGYADLVIGIHSMQYLPRGQFKTARFPALKLKIVSARRGTPSEAALQEGKPTNCVIDVDISFNESMHQVQVPELTGGQELHAYGLVDLMAEKLRAVLQQVGRRRNRRQDIYDLDRLIAEQEIDETLRAQILEVFFAKCRSRDIEPDGASLDDPEVKRRSAAEWETMKLELGEVPNFEDCFARVSEFYRNLPW